MQYDTLINIYIKLRMGDKLNAGSMRKFYLVSQKSQTSGFFRYSLSERSMAT